MNLLLKNCFSVFKEECWLIGWGIPDDEDIEDTDEKLKKVDVPFYDFEQCKKIYHEAKLLKKNPINSKNICAGPPQLLKVKKWRQFKKNKKKHRIYSFYT